MITAKKLLEDITETSSPNKEGDITVEVEDHGTQMSPAMANKRSRRKHTLYKESLQISEPLDCGSFVVRIFYFSSKTMLWCPLLFPIHDNFQD